MIIKPVKRYKVFKLSNNKSTSTLILNAFTLLIPSIIFCCSLCCKSYAAQQNAVWNDADSLAALQQFNFNNQAAVTKNREAKLYSPPISNNADYAESPHQLRLLKTHKDNFDGTYHDRYDQYYKNIPVWGSQLIFHVDPKNNKKTLVNGHLVTGVEKDLTSVEPSLSKNEILKFAQDQYQSEHPKARVSHPKVELVIFIYKDKNNKQVAKLAYTVTFFAQFTKLKNELIIEEPFYIIDANNRQVYEYWNNLRSTFHQKNSSAWLEQVKPIQNNSAQTNNTDNQAQIDQLQSNSLQADQIQQTGLVKNTDSSLIQATDKAKTSKIGRGLGGNMKNNMENPNGPYKFQYGNTIPGWRSLGNFEVTAIGDRCFMKTDDFEVVTLNQPRYDADNDPIPVFYSPENEELELPVNNFSCHFYLEEKENDSFSPSNDAMYAATNTINMYRSIYNFTNPFGTTPGVPIRVYTNITDLDNGVAIYKDEAKIGDKTYKWHSQIFLGSGKYHFYPFTDIGTVGHELSHLFTRTYSGLVYQKQSGGINEAFSDIAGAALIDYIKKQGYSWYPFDWTIGQMITKPTGYYRGNPTRYFYDPPLDGHSIDNAKNYNDKINVHYSSGIFNKAFYLLSTTPGWSIEKAFTLFVNANANCWIKSSTFDQAACCVFKEAEKRKMPTDDVINAFGEVGVSTECKSST